MFVIGALPALLCILIFRRLEGARALEGRAADERGRSTQARLAHRAVRRPALAAEHDRRHAPGVRRRGRPLGDRLLQLRPDRASSTDFEPGTLTAESRQATFWTGIDLAAPEPRRLLRHLRLHAPARSASAASRRSRSRSSLAMVIDRVHLLVPQQLLADLLDDPDHGLLPARALRRLRDLLPRAVPDPAAEHRHLVLLQRRPASSPRSARSRSACSPAASSPARPSRCATRA